MYKKSSIRNQLLALNWFVASFFSSLILITETSKSIEIYSCESFYIWKNNCKRNNRQSFESIGSILHGLMYSSIFQTTMLKQRKRKKKKKKNFIHRTLLEYASNLLTIIWGAYWYMFIHVYKSRHNKSISGKKRNTSCILIAIWFIHTA